MAEKLVSIITPCYNSGSFINRLLDSILEQDYQYIEMILVDDGSIDNTKAIIEEYTPIFKNKGYNLMYIYQENAGQSVAINNALKLVNGEYLVWPDSDDFYSSKSSISKMVSILENSDDTVSMVRCLSIYLDDKNLTECGRTSVQNEIFNERIFEDCLYNTKNFWFGAGNYMAKMSIVDECIKNREIYTEKNAGQNWQMLLPLSYPYRCLTLREYLYNILSRHESHSRGQYITFDDKKRNLETFNRTITNTLYNIRCIPLEKKNEYIYNINKKYLLDYFNLCLSFHQIKEAKRTMEKLSAEFGIDLSIKRKIKYTLYKIFGWI